ncbi:MAG: hypothetical protein ACI8W8_003298 [Rhodothermales bacterium]
MRAITLLLAASCLLCSYAKDKPDIYVGDQVYNLRPHPDREAHFGHIGVTGIVARVYPGARIKVQDVLPDTPAADKVRKRDIILGVNGTTLAGHNPFVVLGQALDMAESSDGKLVFDLENDGQTRQESLSIPVLGGYSNSWPVNCAKSAKIARQAAEYYATNEEYTAKHLKGRGRGIPEALTCLFLLSTGDDTYLPLVKAYFERFPIEKGLGDHTWNNGYNGIACAEYYLRTGDASVLPILQDYCDDARERQAFGRGWNHWGQGVAPRYVSGGLMNPASAQVVTTLLLAKECGVRVHDKTLLNALRFWYRFTGHGTVPYGDHRPEGGLGSNGKDGMAAIIMQVASGATGDVSAYELARDYYSMSTLSSYPLMIRGHGDNGRGDAIWRGLAAVPMLERQPEAFHGMMQRLQWWFALCRRPSGGFGVTGLERFDDEPSGIGVALNYTAYLKHLRITGAKRSPYARDFQLPETLWGTAADRRFHDIDHNSQYSKLGNPEPIHVPFYKLGSAYSKGADPLTLPRDFLLQNSFHARYMIRCQAGKALRQVEAFDYLETLLRDEDPRVRRAALDGMTDYRYWFAAGRDAIKAEQFTPAMIDAIEVMLKNPDESWWVIDGALMALQFAPPADIDRLLPQIQPFIEHEDWWLRESAFMAMAGLQHDDALLPKVLPTLNRLMTAEYHTQPRRRMLGVLQQIAKRKKTVGTIRSTVLDAFVQAVRDSKIKADVRSREGAYNVVQTALASIQDAPETALNVGRALQPRLELVETKLIIQLVGAPTAESGHRSGGFFRALSKLPEAEQAPLKDLLLTTMLPELKARLQAGDPRDLVLIDSIIAVGQLANPDLGWNPIGSPAPEARIWRFMSVDPTQEKDKRPLSEQRRHRKVKLPADLAKWYMPEFDDSAWQQGAAPIGVGEFRRGKTVFENASAWGEGEFLLARTAFELSSIDYDLYRLSALTKNGFIVYLNGRSINSFNRWEDSPQYRPIILNQKHVQKHLKVGSNVLAVYAIAEYAKGQRGSPLAQIDVFLNGLRSSDLK